jgi:hypothetical protein
MRFSGRSLRIALVAAAGLGGVVAFGAPARAETAAEAAAATPGDGCEEGRAREGSACMHQIAKPGDCASSEHAAAESGSAGGGGCGEGLIGAASGRFSPLDVAAGGPTGFLPPAPGPGAAPQPQPCDIGCGAPGGGPGGGGGPSGGGGPGGGQAGGGPPPPPPAPPIVVIESPAPPDPLPGLP